MPNKLDVLSYIYEVGKRSSVNIYSTLLAGDDLKTGHQNHVYIFSCYKGL